MVSIKKQIVISRAKTYYGDNGRKYITIHETANTSKGANAQAHANLQSKGFSASWHYTVDDKQAIQSFPHTARCWHAGDSRGNGNLNSIGVEICVNSDGDFKQAVGNAAELVKKIMKEENISIMNVVQHNKWSGKNCPANLRSGSKGVNWTDFLNMLKDKPKVADRDEKVKSEIIKQPSGTIATIQSTLNSRYGFDISVDNIFGPETKRALIRAYQTELNRQFGAGLVVDGIFGLKTKAASVTVRKGAKGNLTWIIQAMLYCLGFDPQGLDSVFGDLTEKAVRTFQRDEGIAVDGVPGPVTFSKMFA